jgi:beta-lactamase regulating signal transducer with metallopeptidase domain
VDTLLRIGLGNALAAAALALPAAVVSRTCRRPALAHGLWLLVLLRLVAPPVWVVPLPGLGGSAAAPPVTGEAPADPAEVVESGQAKGAKPVETAPPDEPADSFASAPSPVVAEAEPVPSALTLQVGLCLVWLAGSLSWWACAAWRVRRFGRLLLLARPAPAEVRERSRRLAERLGLSACPAVCVVEAAVSPLLWGLLGRPRVLLPLALWGRLSRRQQDALLLHELAHLKRRDYLVRRLEVVVLGLFWWYPVAWWARRELQEAEEQCCDAAVVAALPGAVEDYAEALVETLAFLSEAPSAPPLGASGAGAFPLLKRRLMMILEGKPTRATSRAGVWAVMCLGAAALPFAPGLGHGEQAPAVPGAGEAPGARAKAEEAVRKAEVESARAQVKLLEAQREANAARLRQVEARLAAAKRRLAKLAGQPAPGDAPPAGPGGMGSLPPRAPQPGAPAMPPAGGMGPPGMPGRGGMLPPQPGAPAMPPGGKMAPPGMGGMPGAAPGQGLPAMPGRPGMVGPPGAAPGQGLPGMPGAGPMAPGGFPGQGDPGAGQPPGGMMMPGRRPSPEQRLTEMSKQIDRLRKEMAELRRELRRKGGN